MDIHINYEEFLVVVLTGIIISIVSVILYTIFIALWGKGTHFGYVRLLFISSIVGGGIISAYFIYTVNDGKLFYSVLYGVFTSLIVFLLIGLVVVNIYGT
jgi:hypothetical protein